MDSALAASYVIVFEGVHAISLPNLRLLNEASGELLTFGPDFDDHGIAQQQQQQQANNNANNNGNPLARKYLRRRPIFGPLRYVDMNPFDRLNRANAQLNNNGQQQLAPTDQLPMILIDLERTCNLD